MLSHAYGGLGAAPMGASSHGMSSAQVMAEVAMGFSIHRVPGQRVGAASWSWWYCSFCTMALVTAPAHGLTLVLFLLHQPQGPGYQPAWDCAQRQDAAVRVVLAWNWGCQGSGVHPDQALTVLLPPLTSSCPVMLVVGDNAPAEEGVVSDGVVPVGGHADGAHAWACSCSLTAQTHVSSHMWEHAQGQTCLLVWA